MGRFLIVDEGLRGSLPKAREANGEGLFKQCRGGPEESHRRGGPLKPPSAPSPPGPQSAGAGSRERLSLPPETLMRV